ncbi:MAG: flagellin, partial [Hyphomicrobiales bacterium]
NLTFAEGTNTPLADLGLTVGTVDASSTSGIELGDSFSVQVGTAAATTITFGTGTGEVNSQAELLSTLNAISDVTASITDEGYLKLEATNGDDLTIAEGTNTPLADLGLTVATSTAATNNDRTAFATQFNELRTQIDELADDASFNGINLLDGDNLTVTFNEDATSTLGVDGVTFNSNGLGISSSQNTFQTDADINAAIADLKGATDTLRAQASKFGSNLSVVETRQDFTKNLINVLETGAANLTLADTNEEGANLLALQTRQQLSSTALSLASQADQNVLQLF